MDPKRGNILFTGLHKGVLASFRPDGRTNYIVNTIDPVPLPHVRVDAIRSDALSDGGQTAALSLSVDDGTAICPSGSAPRGGAVPLVDEYTARDGSYLASFPAPEACHQVIAQGRKLYTVSAIGVTVWRRGYL